MLPSSRYDHDKNCFQCQFFSKFIEYSKNIQNIFNYIVCEANRIKKYPAEYILIKMAKEGEPTDIHILTNCDQIVQDICLIQKGCRNDDYTGALVIYDYKHDVNI
jgi:hypothetical protein